MPLLDEPCVTAGELVIAMIDIDHFKSVQRLFGAPRRRPSPRQIADTITIQRAVIGPVARWGGEEFLVVLSEITVAQAVSVLERDPLSTPSDQTCSIGYTAWRPGETIEECISRADRAMCMRPRTVAGNRTHDCPGIATHPQPRKGRRRRSIGVLNGNGGGEDGPTTFTGGAIVLTEVSAPVAHGSSPRLPPGSWPRRSPPPTPRTPCCGSTARESVVPGPPSGPLAVRISVLHGAYGTNVVTVKYPASFWPLHRGGRPDRTGSRSLRR